MLSSHSFNVFDILSSKMIILCIVYPETEVIFQLNVFLFIYLFYLFIAVGDGVVVPDRGAVH